MSRSQNSRKGQKGHRQGGRHHQCPSPSCSYCARNFQIQALRAAGVASWKRRVAHPHQKGPDDSPD